MRVSEGKERREEGIREREECKRDMKRETELAKKRSS